MNTSTRRPVHGKPSPPPWHRREPHELADSLIERGIEAERTFLAAFWQNPFAGYDAACDARLSNTTFTIPSHGLLFWYICTTHEADRPTNIGEIVAISKTRPDSDWEHCELEWLLTETEITPGAEFMYADVVHDFSEKRRAAQAHLLAFAELCAGDDYVILVRRKHRPIVSRHVPANESTDELLIPNKLRSALRRRSRAVTL